MIGAGRDEEYPTEKEIDHTLEETFPASDLSRWMLGTEPLDARQDVEPSGL